MTITQFSGAVTAPGLYAGIPSEVYHGQAVADAPSISSSFARTLLNECPAYAWANSSLNPDYAPEPKDHFDFGTAAHLVFLEPELVAEKVAVIDADSWRTKAAQEARDAARADGKLPMLRDQFQALDAMRTALHSNRIARQAFVGGHAELSAFAKVGGVWTKARPDYLRADIGAMVDYKTSTTANPAEFARKAFSYGYHQQAAWYIDVIKAATGTTIRDFWFAVQDKNSPFLVSVSRFDDSAIQAGRVLNQRALDLFRRCVDTGEWPGYRNPETPDIDTAFVLSLPVYAQRVVEQLIAA